MRDRYQIGEIVGRTLVEGERVVDGDTIKIAGDKYAHPLLTKWNGRRVRFWVLDSHATRYSISDPETWEKICEVGHLQRKLIPLPQ